MPEKIAFLTLHLVFWNEYGLNFTISYHIKYVMALFCQVETIDLALRACISTACVHMVEKAW